MPAAICSMEPALRRRGRGEGGRGEVVTDGRVRVVGGGVVTDGRVRVVGGGVVTGGVLSVD